MDESVVQRVAESELPVWVRRFGLGRYRIRLYFGKCENENHVAECVNNLPYNRVAITLDPAGQDEDMTVRDNVRHELVHVLLSEYELIWQMTRKAADPDSAAWIQFETAWTLASERTVKAIEDVLDNVETWKDEPNAGNEQA